MSERVRAKKSLGQNFLIDPNIQRKIVAAVEPQPDDVVVEIGPGQGALTHHLVAATQRVIAIELDDRLADQLRDQLGSHPGFELVHADALEVDLGTLELPNDFKIIGNIPYNITTPLLFKLLQRAHRPRTLVVMVQKEVAIRVTASAGQREYGALSIGVQSIADAERLFNVPRGAFRPVPGVDSAVLRIRPHHPARLSADEEADVRHLTRATFSQRRKQLQKILRTAPAYMLEADVIERLEASTGIRFSDRPEMLPPLKFVELARALRAFDLPRDIAA